MHKLITINGNIYQIKFGILSLINLMQILDIKDEKELLKQKFYLSDIKRLDNTSITFQEKEFLFKEILSNNNARLLEDVLSEALALSKGDYIEINQDTYDELFVKIVGEVGLSVQEFNDLTPKEIDFIYLGYLQKKELEANCNLIALRKSKDNKATLISLLGGNGYKYISEKERMDVLKSLNI